MTDYLSSITTDLGPRKNGLLGISLRDTVGQLGDIRPKIPDLSNYPGVSKEAIEKAFKNTNFKNQITALGTDLATDYISNLLSNKLFDDSELGRGLGTLFSSGVSSAGNTISNNLIKGLFLTQGLGLNVGNSLAGAGTGLAANYLGKGITAAMEDSRLGRAVGQGISTGLGTLGGAVASNLINGTKTTFLGSGLFSKVGAGAINPYALGATVLGSALGAAAGPSKEYAGRHGGITQTMDTAYDLISAGVNFIPGVGQGISAAMVLNKGLSNIFGSTDGMTVQDAILGSAFMPAPVKWLNMAGASTTGTFNNQSWQNSEKASSFMGNAFGNLQKKFDQAREEAGKTYGMFSQGAKDDALENIDFANYAWNRILAMADLNELQNIRSLAMSSINNQRYAQKIQGGYKLTAIGKQGMKIFNNATNHNIGMRLLSGAALIDNKQMILSAQGGTKVTRPPRMRAHRKGDESRGLTPEEQEWWKLHEEEQKRQLEEETARKIKEKEEAADKFNKQTNTVIGAMTLQANEAPFTGLEYQQAAEDLRQKKVEKFHEAEKIGEAALMADLAVSAAPLLLRGFRWAFNKAGLLVKIPVQKTSLGNLKLTDLDVVEDTRTLASLESDYKGKPVILSVPKTMRKADSDVAKMNEYHAVNVLEYNQSTGNNVTSIPFRTNYNGRLVKVLPNEEFNTIVRNKNTNAPSGSELNVGGMYSKNDDIVYLRNTGNPSNNYHEFLHSSRYGETNPEVTLWRILQLIDEDKISKMTPQQKAYYISEKETPVHLRLQGERMNIEVGDPYPGDEAFDKMLNEYGIGGATYYMKRDTSEAKQLLWKAFNGTLFSGLTAATLYNTKK